MGSIMDFKDMNESSVNVTELEPFDFYQVETLTFLWILFACIVLGNSAVLAALPKGRKSRMNFFIMHLAIAGRRARWLVALAWAASVAMSLPSIFLNGEAMVHGRLQCWIELELWQWQVYMTLVAGSLFFIPALLIAACYSVIVYTIWKRSKILKGAHGKDIDTRRTSSRGVIPKAKVKTVKMTLIIVLAFVFCWSPYFIYDLLQVYGATPKTQAAIAVATFIQSLAPLNSVANPLIYCFFSSNMCRHIRHEALLTLSPQEPPSL
ncbi:hypothetical protein MRX96_012877 [Rhipicephalus microplus]